jgi:hypothetical protein
MMEARPRLTVFVCRTVIVAAPEIRPYPFAFSGANV